MLVHPVIIKLDKFYSMIPCFDSPEITAEDIMQHIRDTTLREVSLNLLFLKFRPLIHNLSLVMDIVLKELF